jgi:beta-glucanase (GH16 family)
MLFKNQIMKSCFRVILLLLTLALRSQGQTPQIFQEFNPWSGNTSPDDVWRKNGTWVATGNNTMMLTNVGLNTTYQGQNSTGFLSLRSESNTLNGAEIQTLSVYGPGYYETRMKVTSMGDPSNNKGVCASFFFIEKNYGSQEFDFEFLTNESWIITTNTGKVHLTIHPSGKNTILDLGFNPSLDFHRYGFLWQSGKIDFIVDGVLKYTITDTGINASIKGYIMMNSWTGNVNWGGNAPAQDAITYYDWVKFYPDITTLADTIPKIHVSNIFLSKLKASTYIDSTIKLSASITPSNAADKTYLWSSSNSTIAKVDQTGSITGISEGICDISITSTDGGKSAICSVTVTSLPNIQTIDTVPVTAIVKHLDIAAFEIYPNPSSDGVFNLKFISSESCDVYNYLGQHIGTLKSGEAVLPKGLYLLKSGRYTKKLILE